MSSAEADGPLTDRERREWHAALMLGDILRAGIGGHAAGHGPDYLVLTRLTNAPEHRWSGLIERTYDDTTGQVTISATPSAERTMEVASALHAQATSGRSSSMKSRTRTRSAPRDSARSAPSA